MVYNPDEVEKDFLEDEKEVMSDEFKNKKVETNMYKENTFHNYKIKLPKLKNKYSNSLLNIDKLHKYIGGDVWVCLWFRETSRWGNQVSFEYNRYSDGKLLNSDSNSGSLGRYFVESYFPIKLIPFIKKCLSVFERVIDDRKKNIIINKKDFQQLVDEKFKVEDDNGENKTI